jgi:hypothetical protein
LIDEHLHERRVFGDLIDTAKPIFKRIRPVQPLRDAIVHGVADGYVPTMDAVQFERRQVPDLSHRTRRLHVRFTMLATACHDLFTINKALNDLLISLRALAHEPGPSNIASLRGCGCWCWC